MNAAAWERIQDLVEQAAGLPPGERTRLIADETADDPELRQQIEGMLRCFNATGSFLEEAIGTAAANVAVGKELAAGDRIGAYRVTSTIGHGGMGIVYRAQRDDELYQVSVAIKVVRAGWGANEELFARFRAERQILAAINHPNISRLLDGGITDDGLPFLVMEYVDGVALDQWIAADSPPVHVRLDLFRKLCSAIQYAHQNLIVHRDLKPGNILVTADGSPKLLDFGIAKLLDPEVASGQTVFSTRPAERLMTPEYASPEQIRGDSITTATDIYGLGVLLYEILTGTRPFQLHNLSPGEIERIVCDTQPRPPSSIGLSPRTAGAKAKRRAASSAKLRGQTDLDRIVLKAMHKQPARRYASAADLSADVQRYQQGFPVTARPDSFAYRTRRFLQRNKAASAATFLFFLTVISLSVISVVQARRARLEAASADAVSQYLVGLFDFTQPNATQGRGVSAREILDQGTDRLNKDWNGDPAVKARLLSTLGTVYYRLGALDRVVALLSEAERIYSSAIGPESVEVAKTATGLGDILETQGDYDSALAQYSKALRIYELKQGHNSVEVADELDGIGSIHWDAGDFKGAEAFQKESAEIFTRILGPEAEQTLLPKGNLEVTLASEGKYREAEPLAREILRERIRVLGRDNSNTAISASNLSFILMKTARFEEARPLLEDTLAVSRKLFGEEHPDVGAALVALGGWELEMGHFDAARSLMRQGLAIALRTAGPQSADAAIDQGELARLLVAMGDPAAARPLAETALRTRLARHTPSPASLGESYDCLGLIDLAQNNLPAARQEIEHALQLRRKAFPLENDSIALSYNHLGEVLIAQHDFDGAQQTYAEALRIARKNFPDAPHPITAEALYGMGMALFMQGNTPGAIAALNASLKMQQRLYPAGHPAIQKTAQALQSIEKRAPGRTTQGRSDLLQRMGQ